MKHKKLIKDGIWYKIAINKTTMSKDATSSSSSSSNSSSSLQNTASSSNITADKQIKLNKQLFKAIGGKKENLTLVKKLINQGAYVKAANGLDQTLLHLAASLGHIKVTEFLLQKGADINAVDNHGNTPLHFAILYGRTKTVRLLLQYGADVNAIDQQNVAPLHEVARYGHTEATIDLLKYGADIKAADRIGNTSLHYAASYGHTDAAIVLLQNGADVDTFNYIGRTPLHEAASDGHTKTATALLQHGANPSARDGDGRTAFDMAENDDIRSLLIEYINFQKNLKSIFDKMVESFSETRAARNGKEEVSASNPQTDLDETLEAARNSFEEAAKNLSSKNKDLFSPGFNPLNMALDDKGHSVFHLMANEALKLGDGAERKQYLELLAILAKENGSKKIQEMINEATTISKGLSPSVASDIEEIIVSYLHDNEIERKKERTPTSQIIAKRIMSYADDKNPITSKILEKILSNTNTPKTNIDDNLATALHLAAIKLADNKDYFTPNSINSNQSNSSSSSSSAANKPKKPGIMDRFLDTIFCRNNAAAEDYPTINMETAASSSSTSSGSKEEEKSAPAARGNNHYNQIPATFVQNPSANTTSSKDQQNQR